MLLPNIPATTYISWTGLVIIDKSDNTPYIVNDGKSCMKYIYWDMNDNPYVLKESNEWIKETATKKMIYINENGIGTQVPHDDYDIYYNDTGNGASSQLTGEALGKYNELNGKYMTIKEDVDGIKQVLGSTESGSGSLVERVNKIEKTAEETKETISTVEKNFSNNKELEELRNNINVSMINLGETLAQYEELITKVSEDMEVSSDEKIDISAIQNQLLDNYTVMSQYHQVLIERLKSSEEDNTDTINNLNKNLDALNTSINNLNSLVNDSISDNTIVPSEITTMLNAIANVSVKNTQYKNAVSDAILLGIGGKLVESILDIRKTSNNFSQTISKMEEDIDGETGLKVLVQKNATAIKQTADNLILNYVKYNETTSQLTIGDNVIKLDAGKVLMTGTLTWDSLDDSAKKNLKGEAGSAQYVMLVGDQIFKYDKDGNPNVSAITLNVQVSNIQNPVFDWYYRDAKVSSEWTNIPSNSNLSSFILKHDDPIWGNNSNSITIKVVCGDYTDEMTIVKLHDGVIGEDAKSVSINGNQLFRYKGGFTETPNPTSITLTATRNNISADKTSRWYYRVSESDDWTEITSSKNANTLIVNHDSYFGDSKILMIRYEVETYYDIMTLAKITDGADGYAVLLTNENHSVPCDENGNYTFEAISTAYTYVKVYKGLSEITSFNLERIDDGCTSVYSNGTRRLDVTSLSKNIATVTLNITVDGNTFQKVMTITKSIKGEKGEEGTGVNIIGKLENKDQLPATGKPGDAYVIDGLLYVWLEENNGWSDGVPFRGEQGIPGKNGTDGRTTYLHIKYSNDGKTFTNNNGEDTGDWIGQYTDYIETDSTNFADYKWKKIKGEDGEKGIVANLTNDTHIVPIESDGTFGEDSFKGCSTKITLSYVGQELVNGVSYSAKPNSDIEGTLDTKTGTYTVTNWTGEAKGTYVDLIATYDGVSYTKRFTINRAKNPLDAYTVVLTNEAHIFPGDISNALASFTTCDVLVYRGDQLVKATIGTIENIPKGMTITIDNNNTITPTLNINVNTNLTENGELSIPITVGLLKFTKTFTYSISFKGMQGIPGTPGKDGKDGNSVRVLGRYDSKEQLDSAHPTGNENGDGYIIDKDLWVWTENQFINVGQFQGEDGTSTYVHIRYSNDGVTFTGSNGEEVGTWMGMYVDNIEEDSTVFSKYKWKKIEGSDAKLLSLSASRQTIAFNSDNTLKDNSEIVLTANQQNFNDTITWSTSPNVELGSSGNNRTLNPTIFTNNNQIKITVTGGGLTDSITIVKVLDGQKGSDGTSVKILDSYNSKEELDQAHPDGNENGDGYIIDKDLWVWNGNEFINVGQIKGNDGQNGQDGLNGTSAYIHIKYSNDGGVTFTNNNGEDTGDYMGVYTDEIEADSTNPSDYTWSLTKGNDGWDAYTVLLTNESHTFAGNSSTALVGSANCGIIGYKGGTQVATTIGNITGMPKGMSVSITNNSTTNAYFIVTVSNSMSTKNGTLTIPITIDGITFTKKFTYALSLKGEDGTDGTNGSDAKLLSLSANRQAIAFDKNNSPKDSTVITLTANQQNFNDVITWSTSPNVTLNGEGNTRTLSVNNFTNNLKISITIKAGDLSDTITLVKVIDGVDGIDGSDGTDGVDGCTINLTNDNHSFVANAEGQIEMQQAVTTTVIAYKGSEIVTPSFGTMPTVNGLKITRDGLTITVVALVGSTLASNGSFNIPVIIDGITFNKAFSYSKVKCGDDGADGYTIILTNENHTFPCENNGSIETAITTTTQVKVYQGTKEITPTIGTLPTVDGLTLSKSGTTITITATTGNKLASSGNFSVPIIINDVTYYKVFSWAKAFKGNAGQDGKADLPTWITEWDTGKTTINGSTVLTPKIFAGTVSNGLPTGVAMGKNVFGTSGSYSGVNGIVGYKSGTKTYEFNTNGEVLIGNKNASHISWDGSNLEIVSGSSPVASKADVDKVNQKINEIKENVDDYTIVITKDTIVTKCDINGNIID